MQRAAKAFFTGGIKTCFGIQKRLVKRFYKRGTLLFAFNSEYFPYLLDFYNTAYIKRRL